MEFLSHNKLKLIRKSKKKLTERILHKPENIAIETSQKGIILLI